MAVHSASQTDLWFLRLRRLFAHVVACVRNTLQLPLADVLVPVHVLLNHFLKTNGRMITADKKLNFWLLMSESRSKRQRCSFPQESVIVVVERMISSGRQSQQEGHKNSAPVNLMECSFPPLLFFLRRPFSWKGHGGMNGEKVKMKMANPGSSGKMAVKPVSLCICMCTVVTFFQENVTYQYPVKSVIFYNFSRMTGA